MNKQTKAYRKVNLSLRVVKGAAVPKDGYKTSALGNSLELVEFDSTKGRAVNSREERKASGRKPWKGGTAGKTPAPIYAEPEAETVAVA